VRAEQAQRRVDQQIRLKVLPGARRAVIVRRPDRSSSRRPHEAGRDDSIAGAKRSMGDQSLLDVAVVATIRIDPAVLPLCR
jgi:hypothetical protein